MAATVNVSMDQEIARPVDEVFDFIADMANDPQWCDWVGSAKLVNGDAPCKGAVFEIEQMMGDGSYVPMQFTITEYDRPNRLAWHMDNDIFDYRSEMDFEATPSGTRISQKNTNIFKQMPDEAAAEIQAMVDQNGAKQMANLAAKLAA